MHTAEAAALQTDEEVSHRLQVTTACLAGWRHRGKGPRFVKVGKLVRYDKADVDAWIAEQTRQTT